LFSGRITPEEYADTLQEIFERTGEEGYLDQMDIDRRNARNVDRILASYIFKFDSSTNKEQNTAVELRVVQLMNSIQGADANNYYNNEAIEKMRENKEKR